HTEEPVRDAADGFIGRQARPGRERGAEEARRARAPRGGARSAAQQQYSEFRAALAAGGAAARRRAASTSARTIGPEQSAVSKRKSAGSSRQSAVWQPAIGAGGTRGRGRTERDE